MEINLADPAFEPTDEQLQQLARDAFADVGERHRAALARLRARILAGRAEAMELLQKHLESEPR